MKSLSIKKAVLLIFTLLFSATVFSGSAYALSNGVVTKDVLPADITGTSAVINGSYTLDSSRVVQTLFLWGTTPLIKQADETNQTSNTPLVTEPEQDSGDFSATLTGLTPGGKYYYRALLYYNDLTSAIGEVKSFQTTPAAATPPPPPPAPPAAVLTTSGLVVCLKNCGFPELIKQVQKIISFLLYDMAVPIAAIIFAYAGFTYLTSGGDPAKATKAKSMFLNVFIGLAIALAAWLIVNTILTSLLKPSAQSEQYNLLKQQ